jgi:hypothetical protein
LVCWSTQTGWPVAHAMLPSWHAFELGVQLCPCVHALHAPAKQTWFWPQLVPLVFAPPRSVQTGRPVAHEVAPVWHGNPAGSQEIPGVHAPHAPALQ